MPANIVTLTDADIAAFPPSNYVNPFQRYWTIPLLAVIYAICSSMYFIRTWTRTCWTDLRQSTLGWDDLCLFCGWGLHSLFAILGLIGELHFGALRHMWDIPRHQWAPLLLLMYIGQIFFIVATGFLKISILLFYRRLTDIAVARVWKLTIWAAIGLLVLCTFVWTGFTIFSCAPVTAFWKAFDEHWDEPYTCINAVDNNLIAGICAAVTDLYTVVLPLIITRKLPLARSKRIALNAMFMLGLITVAISSLRTYFHWRMTYSTDVSWELYNTFTAAQLEMSLGIICASAPACWAFQKKCISRPFRKLQLQSSVWLDKTKQTSTPGSTTIAAEDSARRSSKGSKGTAIELTETNVSSSNDSRKSFAYVPPKLNIRVPPPPIGESRESMDPIVPLSPVRSVEEFASQDWEIIEASRTRLRHASSSSNTFAPCPGCGMHSIDQELEKGLVHADNCSDSSDSLRRSEIQRPKT